jgi:hypothetical protein
MSDPGRDFDFFFGTWNVRHRCLKTRLAGGNEWIAFDGTCRTQPMLGGLGNLDDNVLNMPGAPYRAVTLRAFDPKSQLWSIWWLDGRYPDKLDVPMVGSFKNGVGTFLADDVFEGKPIKVRFLWTHERADTCRWEQAFTPAEREDWETNWIMDFTKVA